MKKSIISLLSILVLLTPTYVLAIDGEEGGGTTTPTPTPIATPTPEPATSPEPTTEETPEPENTPTPTPTPTPEVKKDPTYRLKSVKITGAEFIKPTEFKATEYDYVIRITDEKNFSIEATALDEGGSVSYNIDTDNINIDFIKENGIKIWTVVDGKSNTNQRMYKFLVEKKEVSSKLSKLELEGGNYPFNEKFDKDTTNYTVTIPNEVDTITINAIAEDSNAKVTISPEKTTDLKVGTNTFKITVKNGGSSTSYTLRVTRSEEEEVEEKATSIITVTSDDLNKPTTTEDFNEPENPDSTFNLIIITLASLFLMAIGILGIYFYIKTSPRRMKKEILKERNKKSKQESKEESPIIEVTHSNVEKEEQGQNMLDNADNIIENLEDTKEFK